MRRLLLALSLLLSPDFASAAVPGSKLIVTFEGLAQGHRLQLIANGYDGFNWSGGLYAAPKGYGRSDVGFRQVLHGKVAGVVTNPQQSGLIIPTTGLFSMKSGTFAALGEFASTTRFRAYLHGHLVGSMMIGITQSATLIRFDKSFSKIDKLEIEGQVVFDNLRVTFEEP